MVNYRATASVAVLAVLGIMFAAVPISAAATTPAVRLSGELVQVADQRGAGLAAIRLADGQLVPITAESVKDIASAALSPWTSPSQRRFGMLQPRTGR
jgi:hypothetical protein